MVAWTVLGLAVWGTVEAQPIQYHGEIVDQIQVCYPYDCLIDDLVMDGDTLWVTRNLSTMPLTVLLLAYVGHELVDQVSCTLQAPNPGIDVALGLEKDGDGFVLSTGFSCIYHLNRDGTIADSCRPVGEASGLFGLTWRDSALWAGVCYWAIAQLDSSDCDTLRTARLPFSLATGMACDDEGDLWMARDWYSPLTQVDPDLPPDQMVIGELHLPPEIWGVNGLDFDGQFFWLTETYGSIYKIRVLEWDAAPEDPPLPTTFWVGEPYPNPFNQSLTIPYSLPSGSGATVTVSDLLGREVYRFVVPGCTGSQGVLKWDGTTSTGQPAGSGSYFVCFLSSRYTAVLGKRVLLLR